MSMIFSTDDDSNKENDRLVNADSAPAQFTNDSDIMGLHSIFEAFINQINDCQTVGAAVRANLQRQREELNTLFQTQQKLQRSQQDLLNAFAIWIKAPMMPPDLIDSSRGAPNIVDGTVTSSQINPAKTTAAFCVGMPSLTAASFRRYAAALTRAQSLEETGVTEEVADIDKRKGALRDLQSARVRNDRRPVRSVSAPYDRSSHQVNNIMQSLLGGANWRRAIDLVSHLRTMDKQASEAVHSFDPDPGLSSPVPPGAGKGNNIQRSARWTEEPNMKSELLSTLDELRMNLQIGKASRPLLLGRDDYLYIAVAPSLIPAEGHLIRSEIILPSANLYEAFETRADSSDDVNAALQWAAERTRDLPSTLGLTSQWDGDFSNFDISQTSDEAREHFASIRFIPLVAGSSGKDLSALRSLCPDSKFLTRWSSSRNGMWKAEISQRDKATCAAMQRSIKQAGSYQKAMAETMQWLLLKCKQEDITSIWYRSREDCFVLDISRWLSSINSSSNESHKKRLRRQSAGSKSLNENSGPNTVLQTRDEKLGCKKRK